jgi:hypothetical protein
LLRTIEAAGCRSPSRAPETHRAILHLLQSPPVGRTAAPFLSSWPWLVPRCARCWCPKVASPGRLWCASHAGPCVRFPRSAQPLHPLDNINMLPIRAGTTIRQWQRPTVTGVLTGFCLKTRHGTAKLDWNSVAASRQKLLPRSPRYPHTEGFRKTRLWRVFSFLDKGYAACTDHVNTTHVVVF